MNDTKGLKKILYALMMLSVTFNTCADEISRAIDLTFKVNVLKPVCRLASGNQTIDFGDFDALDVATGSNKVNGSTTFKFTECSAVNHLKIKFTQAGQNPAPDTANNYIPNQAGDTMAGGVAVRLLNESHQILSLKDTMDIQMRADQTTQVLVLNARVVPADMAGKRITPGLLQTAVGLEISYE
ncbi:fimbrial protein [Escherichia albertii]|uniref:fimbrial protein n=1 Tax=Escherichia albertii TaxID=208962 RepID=UPI0013312656|nr:fimbrial protein [Escherichia albertii]KAF0950595.1 Cro/Cl family transcriptional regulator [Escherichia albertii]